MDRFKQDLNTLASHFALLVLEQLQDKYSEEEIARSGFKVKTSLDLKWQEYAESQVTDQVKKLAPRKVSNGAAVVIDPKTYQPDKYSAKYSPKNYDGKFRGPVTVRRALANSLNVPAVEVMNKVGVSGGLEAAKRLGINSLGDNSSDYGLSMVLGAGEVQLLEITGVYAVFANQGQKLSPTAILEIDDKFGNKIYTYESYPVPVLDPKAAFLISSILSDNNARREVFGNNLTISRPAAVKTGTAESYKDSLTVGYTPSLVIGVWVGNNDGSPMDSVAGSLGAAPIWKALMEKYLKGTPVEKFTPPEGIITKQICESTTSARLEYFIQGTEPERNCSAPKLASPSASF